MALGANTYTTASNQIVYGDTNIAQHLFQAGNVGIGVVSPTSSLHLKAGTATANTAPIKLNTGVLNTTPEVGAIEYDGTNVYFVNSSGVRKQLAVV